MKGFRYYPAKFVMRSKDPGSLRIIDLWSFRSSKSHKRYIVEVEHFSSHFIGIKFYWKGVEASEDRYSLLTNDFEPRTIVMSCIQVMMYYYDNDSLTSFGFVGAHDLIATDSDAFPNKRFRFYRRMMLSLFSSDKFIQINDPATCIYMLVNKIMLEKGIFDFSSIEDELGRMYEGEYHLILAD